MNKKDFFLKAMQAGEYRRIAWIISAFSIIYENPQDWQKDPYPYRIVQTPSGAFFVDPSNQGQLSPIEGSVAAEPVFKASDKLELLDAHKAIVTNLQEPLTTTYGNLLINFIVLIYPFGGKIAFINKRFMPKDVEKIIVSRWIDDPDDGIIPPQSSTPLTDPIYVSEALKFRDAAIATDNLATVFVPAATEKTMTVNPEIYVLREKLLKENEGRLHDPAVVASIISQLVAKDKEWFKDDKGKDFLINAKSFDVVRKKLFLMQGTESSLDPSQVPHLIKTSLSEGWKLDDIPAMVNASRAGSFNRGAQTELGGATFKWLLRAASNVRIVDEDCGSTIGSELYIDANNAASVVGRYFFERGRTRLMSKDDAGTYIGQTLKFRSFQYCKVKRPDSCKVCAGLAMAENPRAAATELAEMGSVFMLINMKAMHGKAQVVNKLDWRNTIR